MGNIPEMGLGQARRPSGPWCGALCHDDHTLGQVTGEGGPSLTSHPFSASRTELDLQQLANSNSFSMGVWPRVRRGSF